MHDSLLNRIEQMCACWRMNHDSCSGTWEAHFAIVEISRQRPRELELSDYWDGVSLASYSVLKYNFATLEEVLDMQAQAVRAVVAALST